MATLVRRSTTAAAAPRLGRRLARTSVPISARMKLSGRNLGRDMLAIWFIEAIPKTYAACLTVKIGTLHLAFEQRSETGYARTGRLIKPNVRRVGLESVRPQTQRAFPRETNLSSCLAARVRGFSSHRKHAPVRIADPFIVIDRERRV